MCKLKLCNNDKPLKLTKKKRFFLNIQHTNCSQKKKSQFAMVLGGNMLISIAKIMESILNRFFLLNRYMFIELQPT